MTSTTKWELGTAKVLSREPLETSKAKWIGLESLKWQDEEGKERIWESASRKTRKGSGIDAVAIFAMISAPKKPLSTVLVMQYRPPIGKVCVELPAGLVDEGESPEQAAVRELKEEVGYENVEVGESSGEIFSDPGLASTNMCLVTIKVNVKEDEPEPEQQLDNGEHIVKRLVPVKDLYKVLQEYSEKNEYAVDARLFHLAQGLNIAQSLQ